MDWFDLYYAVQQTHGDSNNSGEKLTVVHTMVIRNKMNSIVTRHKQSKEKPYFFLYLLEYTYRRMISFLIIGIA